MPYSLRRLYIVFKKALGLDRFSDIEIRRKVYLINLFSTVGFLFLLLFGFKSLLDQRYLIAVGVLGGALLTLINFLIVRLTPYYRLASHGVSLIIVSIALFLLVTGGVDRTGPLWTYVSVPLVMFLQGPIVGLLILIGYLLAAFAILYLFGDGGTYTEAFKLRYLASYVALLIMSWLYEKSRFDAHVRWRKLSREFETQARTDVLTGISNRRDILEKLEYENIRAKRRGETYSILLLDIDHFKSINDTYGHDLGDTVLKILSREIAADLFERDLFGRWGGEEFLIVLPDTDARGAVDVAERIRKRIADLSIPDHRNMRVTASIGVASSDVQYEIDRYISLADLQLYRAKTGGRNLVVSPEMNPADEHRAVADE